MSPRELCPLKGVPASRTVTKHLRGSTWPVTWTRPQMGKEGSKRMCKAHSTRSCLEEMLPTQAAWPPHWPLQEAFQAAPEELRPTHVGLGAGGLDVQEIRKSFFLLDFPKRERREHAVNHWSTNLPRDREGQAPRTQHRHRCQRPVWSVLGWDPKASRHLEDMSSPG